MLNDSFAKKNTSKTVENFNSPPKTSQFNASPILRLQING